jgi:Sec-independent protein translocase protein TatA
MELGMGEIVLILLVALLVYGGRLPQVAAAVGRSVAELKRGLRSTTDLVRDEIDEIAELDPRASLRRAWEARPESSTPRDPTPPELAVEDITTSAADEDDEPPTT